MQGGSETSLSVMNPLPRCKWKLRKTTSFEKDLQNFLVEIKIDSIFCNCTASRRADNIAAA